MTTRELATHIYKYIIEKKNSDITTDKDHILYIENLMILHFEVDNVPGAKGFVSISRELNDGC